MFLNGTDPGLRQTRTPTVNTFAAGVGFTAGSSTTVALTADPGTENSLIVTFDGVTQHRDTYSVSGTTVTFDAAIPTGVAKIECTYTTTIPATTPADGSVGTAQLADGSVGTAKLADGAVTAVKTSGIPADKDIRALALEVADLRGIALNFPNGAADPFDSDTLATKTNATYSTSDDYYHNPGTGYTDTFITSGMTMTGEAPGSNNVTNLANLADNDTSTEATVPVPLPSGSRFIKIDLGSGVTKTATKMSIHWQNHSDIAAFLLGVKVEGSNDDASYTTLIDETSGGTANTVKDYTWSNTTAYRYYKLTVKSKNTSSGATNANIIELDMFETATTQNMTLINNALTAASAPSTGFITVQADPVDSVTVNTDIKAEISRDGGSNWTFVTLAEGSTNSNFINYEGSVDISGQPSGTSIKYRVTTLNTKEIRVSGVVLRWA